MSQAPSELAMSQGTNKEQGRQQKAQRASNEAESQRGVREAVMSQRGSKQGTGSHFCGKAESFVVEVFHRWSQASKVGLSAATVEIILSYQACNG